MRAFLICALLLTGCAGAAAPSDATNTLLASDADIAAAVNEPVSSQDQVYVTPFAPFQVLGNIYYVGPAGVSSFLITTPEGHFLVDGGIPQTAPLIEANLSALGFSIDDVRYLLNTHAHADHAGGLAQLKRDSGATFAASDADRPILEAGRISYGPSADFDFPPVRVDRIIADGETLTLGGVTLTAHLTPGHTPGCTSWSLDVRDAGAPHRAFITCSETVAGQRLVPESYPGMVQDYRTTFARVRELEADVFLGSHGVFFDLQGKRARQIAGDADAFVDPEGLQRYNDVMEAAFNAELDREGGKR
jgi:metallo-beta-lactamase class B